MPGFAPKLRVLTSAETQATLDVWRETLIFHLILDGSFEEFLEDNFKWKNVAVPERGLQPDATDKENPRTAKQKASSLKLMLQTIASYAPVISREFIVSEALSLDEIWLRLRIHFGFRKSGALILDLMSLHQEEGESYEALWERYHSFVTDNLLQPSDGITHLGSKVTNKEKISPTLLNMMVTLWLHTINSALPSMVKQKYTTELRNRSLASLREEISESLDSLISQVNGEGACIARAFYSKQGYGASKSTFTKQRTTRVCPLCEATGRQSNHFLSECRFLPEADKKFLSSRARSRAVDVLEEFDDEAEEESSEIDQVHSSNHGECMCKCGSTIQRKDIKIKKIQSSINRVDVVSSPCLWVKYGKHEVNLDTAAEADVIKLSFVRKIGVLICSTTV